MRLLYLAILILALSSCSTSYQYLTLSSPEVQKNDKNDFIWENDTMRLTYNFHGEGGPISLTVFNKMDKPLFVNWKKSALIRDGQAMSIYDRKVEVNGSYSGYSTPVLGGRVSSGSTYSTFDLPEGMVMVPPGSYIVKSVNIAVQPTYVTNDHFPDSTKPQKLKDFSGYTQTYKKFSFDQMATPLQFKSYLTFVAGTNPQEFAVMHTFYVQDVYISEESPEFFGLYKPQGDQFYIMHAAN